MGSFKTYRQRWNTNEIAEEYGVGEVIVGDWKRYRDKIKQWKKKKTSSPSSRKTLKISDYEKSEDALFLWFKQQRDKETPLSGPILQGKAMSLMSLFPNENRWRNRHGVRDRSYHTY